MNPLKDQIYALCKMLHPRRLTIVEIIAGVKGHSTPAICDAVRELGDERKLTKYTRMGQDTEYEVRP